MRASKLPGARSAKQPRIERRSIGPTSARCCSIADGSRSSKGLIHLGCQQLGRSVSFAYRTSCIRAHRVAKVAQGKVWWADLPEFAGSGPGFRRPVVVVQGNHLNQSRIATILCVPLTSNLVWADAPGNTLLPAKATGLSKNAVANASQIVAIDRSFLEECIGRLLSKQLAKISMASTSCLEGSFDSVTLIGSTSCDAFLGRDRRTLLTIGLILAHERALTPRDNNR